MDKFKQGSIVLALAVFLVLFVLIKSISPIQVQVSEKQNDNRITVQGSAERLVAPDTASVTFSMTKKDQSLSAATESVNGRIADMLVGLKKFSVEEKDIQTKNYFVNPEYDYNRENGQRVFNGYRVNQSLELVIRDLDQVGPIMTSIAGFKVDNVSGLSFYVDKDEVIKGELRAEAITDAKQKARKLSKELGVKLDTIVGFSENSGDRYYPQDFARAAYADAMPESVEAAIPVGENTLEANVSVTYQISN